MSTIPHSFGSFIGRHNIGPSNLEYISMPPKAKIRFIMTRNGKSDGNTEKKKSFVPLIV